ncbi:hypothetical protein, partial [Streptomyces hydrogenans]|uniref:hypothetical protein n=1 Tax=Streptomyces hydrogenans TaxID=1873719 RepID=UPI0035E31251
DVRHLEPLPEGLVCYPPLAVTRSVTTLKILSEGAAVAPFPSERTVAPLRADVARAASESCSGVSGWPIDV